MEALHNLEVAVLEREGKERSERGERKEGGERRRGARETGEEGGEKRTPVTCGGVLCS